MQWNVSPTVRWLLDKPFVCLPHVARPARIDRNAANSSSTHTAYHVYERHSHTARYHRNCIAGTYVSGTTCPSVTYHQSQCHRGFSYPSRPGTLASPIVRSTAASSPSRLPPLIPTVRARGVTRSSSLRASASHSNRCTAVSGRLSVEVQSRRTTAPLV